MFFGLSVIYLRCQSLIIAGSHSDEFSRLFVILPCWLEEYDHHIFFFFAPPDRPPRPLCGAQVLRQPPSGGLLQNARQVAKAKVT